MTRKAKGNEALTLTQSTIGNTLGPFLSTALIKLYTSPSVWYTDILSDTGRPLTETYRYVFKQLGLSVFVPLVCLLPLLLFVFSGIWNYESDFSNAFLLFQSTSLLARSYSTCFLVTSGKSSGSGK